MQSSVMAKSKNATILNETTDTPQIQVRPAQLETDRN